MGRLAWMQCKECYTNFCRHFEVDDAECSDPGSIEGVVHFHPATNAHMPMQGEMELISCLLYYYPNISFNMVTSDKSYANELKRSALMFHSIVLNVKVTGKHLLRDHYHLDNNLGTSYFSSKF